MIPRKSFVIAEIVTYRIRFAQDDASLTLDSVYDIIQTAAGAIHTCIPSLTLTPDVETTRRVARGFRNFTNYRIRNLLAAGGHRPRGRNHLTMLKKEAPDYSS